VLWMDDGATEPDTYVAFRGILQLKEDSPVILRTLGASWYTVWLDGEYLLMGPARFPIEHPQYGERLLHLSRGCHVIAAQVHHDGVETRILKAMPPFLDIHVLKDGQEVAVPWRCIRLPGFLSQTRRLSPALGWIEWCDTRLNPVGWQEPGFDDRAWPLAKQVQRQLGRLEPLATGEPKRIEHKLTPFAEGPLAEVFGYPDDDISTRFFLRDLVCHSVPATGLWRRYDLGRVRLGQPRFVLDLPEGAVVEFAYCEWLAHGRVQPYINLSGGPTCNLDHYVARGGCQEFFPSSPRGGRYLEVHVLAPPEQITFAEEAYTERCYWNCAEGSFACDDKRLNTIWQAGVRTLRGCAEDAVVDCPTRERGQWLGDLSVGLAIASYVFSDLRLFRRALIQSAQCAREDGLVAGLSPGTGIWHATYSAMWVGAWLHYYELTGDRSLLEDLYEVARANMSVFERSVTDEGRLLWRGMGHFFVDWGFEADAGPSDVAVDMAYLAALRAMLKCCNVMEPSHGCARYERLEVRVRSAIRAWLDAILLQPEPDWKEIGYHRAALALSLGLFTGPEERDAISYIKEHIMNCFPNNAAAPRNACPGVVSRQLITPYFFHFAFPPLIERGEMDFVLAQYQVCWGYLLDEGRTTLMEVFDPRWSHCHLWSGCPTWQLSRYVLGLRARYDLGPRLYILDLQPGSLRQAQGRIPLPDGGFIEISWKRVGNAIRYQLSSHTPITIRVPSDIELTATVRIHGRHVLLLRGQIIDRVGEKKLAWVLDETAGAIRSLEDYLVSQQETGEL